MFLWRPRPRRPAGFIEPCLPSTAAKPPRGPNWIHELKHDGFRLMARLETERVRLWTRNGNDWCERYPRIVEAISGLRCGSCLIDGEVIVCDAAGLSIFDLLRKGPRVNPHAILCAFDLIELDGQDLRPRPLEERRRRLTWLLRNVRPAVQLSEHLEEDGAVVFEHACRLGCEGIVSKRRGTKYQSGRSVHWLKCKNPNHPAATRHLEEDWNG